MCVAGYKNTVAFAKSFLTVYLLLCNHNMVAFEMFDFENET